MGKQEFRFEALKLGWTKQAINEYIKATENLLGKDVVFDYSLYLMVLPNN